MVHAYRLYPAHPESAWDKERVTPKPIGHKYREWSSNAHQAPTRDQPLRKAKLLVPETNPPAIPQDEIEESVGLNNQRTAQEQTQLSGVVGPPTVGPSHRYNLRYRPG